MAPKKVSKNKNISEVSQNVTLNNLANFAGFDTDEFFVNGTPWFIRFSKERLDKKMGLCVFLYSKFKYNSTEAFIVATCDIMLLSPKHREPYKANICLDAYCKDTKSWGLNPFIDWNTLKKDFTADNKCKLKIVIKATEIMTPAESWLKQGLKFERMVELEEGSDRKFHLTIKRDIQDLIGVCSPKINFNGTVWRIAVKHTEGKIVVIVCNTGSACKMTHKIKLLSSAQNMRPITKEFKDFDFDSFGAYNPCSLIDWIELINPRKKFIQDGTSFVVEVEFKAKQVKPAPKKRPASAKNSGAISSSRVKRRPGAKDSGASVLWSLVKP